MTSVIKSIILVEVFGEIQLWGLLQGPVQNPNVAASSWVGQVTVEVGVGVGGSDYCWREWAWGGMRASQHILENGRFLSKGVGGWGGRHRRSDLAGLPLKVKKQGEAQRGVLEFQPSAALTGRSLKGLPCGGPRELWVTSLGKKAVMPSRIVWSTRLPQFCMFFPWLLLHLICYKHAFHLESFAQLLQ